jgi:hypothetical protein
MEPFSATAEHAEKNKSVRKRRYPDVVPMHLFFHPSQICCSSALSAALREISQSVSLDRISIG